MGTRFDISVVGSSSLLGTSPGVLYSMTASSSGKARSGYQRFSLFCLLTFVMVAVVKASRIKSRREMKTSMKIPCFVPNESLVRLYLSGSEFIINLIDFSIRFNEPHQSAPVSPDRPSAGPVEWSRPGK